MALKKCQECGHEVSTSAISCPKCGAKMPKPKLWLWIPLGLIVAFFIIGAMLPEDEKRNEAEVFTATVKHMMKDPTSFEVVELRVMNSGGICLKFRAKNGFNAYIQANAVKTSTGEVHIDGVSGDDTSALWRTTCAYGSGRSVTVFESSL